MIGNRRKIVWKTYRFSKQTISARYLVKRRYQKRLVDKIDARGERALNAGDHRVEVIKGAKCDLPCCTALRRIGVDVFEMPEPSRIFQISERRHSMPPVPIARPCGTDPK